MIRFESLHPNVYKASVQTELRLDLGERGDITTSATVPAGTPARARLVARQEGRLSGLDVAKCAFDLSGKVRWESGVLDGADIEPGQTLATIEGSAATLLAAERTALNFLGHMSGIATATRDLARRIEGSRAQLADTRKTTPGLRALEKYAVLCGGGTNHRFGLHDAVLIKDNHRQLGGGVVGAIRSARAKLGPDVELEIEVDTLEELELALQEGADAILLDNMSPELLAAAVEMTAGRALLEASGGITAETIAAVAASGVDRISVGWLTHSAPALDVALDFEPVTG